MGSAAEVNEPTTAGTEKLHHPVNLEEEEEEQVVELERKTSSFPHGKRPDSADGSTITTNNSSSSSFSEGIPDPRNGEGEHIAIENLEVPESPVVGFHEEHHDGNVFFDGEEGIWKCRHCDWTYREESLLCFETKGSESADAEPDAHESHTADNLSAEKRERASENGSASEDNNKGPSGEIEEVQDTDLPKEVVAVVVQRTADVIEEEEEVDIDDVEDYNVEKVLDNQETHDLFCPNCHSCITKRVVLKKRKRKIRHAPEDPKRVRGPDPIDPILRSEDNEPSPVGGDSSTPESFFYKCLSCFSIFIPKGVDSKPVAPSEIVERLNTQPKPQEEATAHSNWFGSMFGSKKKEPPVQQGGAMPSIPEASLPRDNPSVLGEETAGSKAPALVQEGPVPSIQDVSEISVSLDNKPVDDTPLIQGKGVNSGATVENGQQFLVPSADEEQTQQKIDRDGATSAADENHSPDKGRLSPIQPSRDMNISNIVTSGPDGVRVETIFHTEGVSHLFEGTEPRKPDFGLAKVTGVMESGDGAPIRGIDIPPLPLSSLEEGTLTEPLVGPAVAGPVVEGRKVEILKSIVYGGLIEAITSLGVISSAAGSGASTLNILVLGLANLFGGLILIIHNLQELREEEPITTEDNQTNVQEEGRYKRLLGRRENFTLHVTVAIISFIIMGLLPPIVYYFSFSKTHNRDYKVASVFGASLLCIVLLALAKAHVRSPRGSHLKSVLKYAMIAVSVSGISYVVGNFVDHLLEKYGWSDGSETPAAEMMLSLLGRKAGSFGYSSSY
ncbi:PREDICTED: membrane protein of ER body-like protein isoform X2 [Brassica oleracea var. oleracea]|uniref:membrane protein of ER body-like protein isoform X2 n=1 Tax=Brassica oleracea var. oleracea TaxID=109376 RepID=UPI0006A6CE79|nr:PREDICTED: membrane protein of ER body-like protein isoform X2 [Brassica oleracea var. oleracea]